jgi:SAM-dependent methyltransferase
MFTLDQIVPWGRSFDEYRRMFALTDDELGLRIVGCGDGPASFDSEATHLGAKVISCDPIYRYDVEQLRSRIASTCDEVMEQTRRNAGEFVWSAIRSVEDLGEVRMAAMKAFLADYPVGKAAGRYIDAELPCLPFNDASFDLALCSHLLFLYTTQLGEAFHEAAIREMCRVAMEVRIFPLLTLAATRSPLVELTAKRFGAQGFNVSLEDVPYEFQRGGNQMMRIRRRSDPSGYYDPIDSLRGAPESRC